jgi:hypothetical protein
MIAIQERIQRAVESILENEALTADLDDQAAKVLLDWGVEQAQAITIETAELADDEAEEAMYQPMRALRKMLRSVNKWANDPQENHLARIMEQAEIIYGSCPNEEHRSAFTSQTPEGATERVSMVRGFLEGGRRDPNDA